MILLLYAIGYWLYGLFYLIALLIKGMLYATAYAVVGLWIVLDFLGYHTGLLVSKIAVWRANLKEVR